MSDAIQPTMKVSREGIVLIKSFEGFRPRAIRREDGGWVIGYSHTLSAREGASVSEADAELLLRYDLLPVEKTVNQAAPAALNQHQFDAMASFAFSVGIDRFQSSDVLAHLARGAIDQAAKALMGWPEPVLPQAALRRRAAERALFVADPEVPVAVSDLLVAPVEPIDDAPTGTPSAIPEPEHDAAIALDPRAAAVSALLGETPPPAPTAAEPVTPVFVTPAATPHPDALTPPAANDAMADPAPSTGIPVGPEIEAEQADVPGPDLGNTPAVPAEAPAQPAPDTDPAEAGRPDEPASAAPPGPSVDATALAVQRYAPYSAAMVGPLPFLPPARDVPPAPSAAPVTQAPVADSPAAAAPSAEDPPVIQPFAPSTEVEPLILSAPEDAPASAMSRPTWSIEDRGEASEPVEAGLFGEDLSLTHGGVPIMRHGDVEIAAPATFDWSETGAFMIMGAVGLTAFGAAMAAFRLASEQAGGNETTIIAWVLAVIGAGCVGVSSLNLYRRWGLPGGDN